MIRLSDHFTYARLLRFTFPSVIMLIFTSIYGVVDGFFVSNYVGKTPFAAVNFIMPVLLILGCTGFMFGTGGSALIAATLGRGDRQRANRVFSLLVWAAAVSGTVLALVGLVFLRPLAAWLGAEGELLADSVRYGRLILLALPFYTLQYAFQCLFAAAEKPKLGLAVTVAAGVTNMVLDALFVAVFSWGLTGAALATALSQVVGGVVPLVYFARENGSLLHLVPCSFDGGALWKACTNGSSELMSNISMSVVSMLYNVQLMRFAGENGIAAYGVLMYVSLIFQAVFIGYAVGVAPVVSFHFGGNHTEELQSLLRKSGVLVGAFSGAMCIAGELLGRPLAQLFAGYDPELLEMTAHAFSIFSLSFLFSGFSIFGSSFFTALNDGVVSAMISFLRTMVFQCAAVLIFPIFWELDGIWWSIVLAEGMALAVTGLFLIGKRRTYRYF